jgi:hypothetical protein
VFLSAAREYESEQNLIAEIRRFIHRYVDVSPLFEQIASYDMLFCWVYDAAISSRPLAFRFARIACIETNAWESKIVGVRNAKTAAW